MRFGVTALLKRNQFIEDFAGKQVLQHADHRLRVAFHAVFGPVGNHSGEAEGVKAGDGANLPGCEKLLTPGVSLICVGFGAGFTWGGALLEF